MFTFIGKLFGLVKVKKRIHDGLQQAKMLHGT